MFSAPEQPSGISSTSGRGSKSGLDLPDPLPSPPSYATNAGPKPAGNAGKMPLYGSTLLTSPMGVDESTTNTNKKSLLGQ